ncbi:TIGR02391 family protein [Sphingomonas sp. I4]
MHDLSPIFPETEVLASLSSAQLAELLIRDLASKPEIWNGRYHKSNVLAWYAACARDISALAFAEAWSWAEANGLLVHSIYANHVGVLELSRSALSLVAEGKFEEFRQAAALPRSLLHPVIAEQAWHLFIVGRYDVAVFAAFKAVEVAVADASGCPGTGTALMRAAFDKDAGPLRDPMLDKGEREAMSHLLLARSVPSAIRSDIVT